MGREFDGGEGDGIWGRSDATSDIAGPGGAGWDVRSRDVSREAEITLGISLLTLVRCRHWKGCGASLGASVAVEVPQSLERRCHCHVAALVE